MREGQADHVEVVAFDPRDVAAGAALYGVGASFVVGLFRGEITRDFFGGELGEMDEGRFDEAAALGVWEANESDARYDGMGAAGKIFQHVAGIVGGAGLTEDPAFESYDRVGGKDDGGADCASGGEFGFGVSEALDQLAGRFAGEGSFVNGGRHDDEGEARVVENFGAARRSRSEDEFHTNIVPVRILHGQTDERLD